QKENEDKIALAAKISAKIKGLCESLALLDLIEYANVCRTDDDAPKWKRKLDQDLTKEQKKEAKDFFNIMSECFQNPEECRCDDISIIPFSEQCKIVAPLAAECKAGNEEACEKMDDLEDPIDLLPKYLQDVMDELEDRYDESAYELHIPKECREAGALDRKSCMKIMFSIHAPPECSEALERGEISFNTDKEARQACQEIMFELEAPDECKEAGLKDHEECQELMFKLDAPQECLDEGLDGSRRDDWKKCDAIRFKLDAAPECVAAGLTGSGRDDWKRCGIIQFKLNSPQECLDAGLDGSGRDDWKKCNAINFKLHAPKECLDAGIDGSGRNDWEKCNKIRKDFDEEYRKNFDEYKESSEDCKGDQTYICDVDGRYCRCVNERKYEEPIYDEKEDDEKEDHEEDRCAAILCQENHYCKDGECIYNEPEQDSPPGVVDEPLPDHPVEDQKQEDKDSPEEEPEVVAEPELIPEPKQEPIPEVEAEPAPEPTPDPEPIKVEITGGIVTFLRTLLS
ncbi:MAG: hypothetical protein ACE5RJ_04800, partial [Nitrosopumilaceae archaeon]